MAKSALKVYRTKRDFSKTAEPAGDQRIAPSTRLRFVVQKHAARRLHYDLRLEWHGVFKSWAVTQGPSLDPSVKRLAVQVEDHPLDYGDFEGTIPAGEYGGGTVQLWDRGYWTPEGTKSTEEMFQKGDLKFTVDGRRLTGSWVLVRMRGDRFGGKRPPWLLIKHRDASAKPGDADALLEVDRSVASGRSLKQIAAGKGKSPQPFMTARSQLAPPDAVWTRSAADSDASVTAAPAPPARHAPAATRIKPGKVRAVPPFVPPQLCKRVERPPDRAGWAHEVKFDGYRAQLRIAQGSATIRTRNGLDWTERFAAMAQDAARLPDGLIDGEIVALDSRRLPSFAALQAAIANEKTGGLVFYAFDLLFQGRDDLRPLPLRERKLRLQQLLAKADVGDRILYVAHLESNAEAVLMLPRFLR